MPDFAKRYNKILFSIFVSGSFFLNDHCNSYSFVHMKRSGEIEALNAAFIKVEKLW